MKHGKKRLIARFLAVAAGFACAFTVRAEQAEISEARRQVLESHMSAWQNVKERANQFSENILQGAIANPQINYQRSKTQLQSGWPIAQYLEKKASLWQSQALAQLAADVSSGKINSQQQSACTAAVNKTFQLRVLYIYGTVFPQFLNDSLQQDGKSIGAQYAGPAWQLEASQQEAQALAENYRSQCPAETALFRAN